MKLHESLSIATTFSSRAIRDILGVVERTPVVAGRKGTDPTRLMPNFLRRMIDTGFKDVINSRTHSIVDSRWHESLEATGFDYDLKVGMIREAVSSPANVFTPDAAATDMVGAHIGLGRLRCHGAQGSPRVIWQVLTIDARD
jgi:predicted TIM-barrel enzyme